MTNSIYFKDWLPNKCTGFLVRVCHELLQSLQNSAAADAECISAVRRFWVTSMPSKIALDGNCYKKGFQPGSNYGGEESFGIFINKTVYFALKA
jgi:hypothetical protein